MIKTVRDIPAYGWFALGAAMASAFGQTFFIGLFGGLFSQALNLTPSTLGYSYGSATLLSGLLMFGAGAWADQLKLKHGIAITLSILMAGCVVIASARSPLALWLGFFLLRFGGQGLTGHLAVVAAARYAIENRGRSVAMASYGFILAEASFPLVVASLLGLFDWRSVWGGAAVVILLISLPGLVWLARQVDDGEAGQMSSSSPKTAPPNEAFEQELTRQAVLRHPAFVLALPMVLGSAFVITALFLHLGTLAEIKGWQISAIGRAFVLFAICQYMAAFLTGRLVDAFGSIVLLRFFLWPMAGAVCVLAWGGSGSNIWWVFAGLGLTAGANGVIAGAIWAELFGIRQLGLVRGVYTAFMVIASAIAPMALGQWLALSLPLAGLAIMAMVICVALPQFWVMLIRRVV